MTLSATALTLCTPLPQSSHLAFSGAESQRPASSSRSGVSNGSSFITAPILLDAPPVDLAVGVPRQALAGLPVSRQHVRRNQGAELAAQPEVRDRRAQTRHVGTAERHALEPLAG